MDFSVIAHRGGSATAPQNTMPAFLNAAKLGADGIETDVRRTKDGHIVLCHNPNVDETSNGQGFVRDYTLKDLRKLDFGSYFSRDFADTRIVTLEELLRFFEKTQMKILNIEIKPTKRQDPDIARDVIDAAKLCGVFDRLLITCFDTPLFRQAQTYAPDCRMGYFFPTNKQILTENLPCAHLYAKRLNAFSLHIHQKFLAKRYLARSHEYGIKVFPWTVNSGEDIKKMIALGADGVITDCPGEALALAGKTPKKHAEVK